MNWVSSLLKERLDHDFLEVKVHPLLWFSDFPHYAATHSHFLSDIRVRHTLPIYPTIHPSRLSSARADTASDREQK